MASARLLELLLVCALTLAPGGALALESQRVRMDVLDANSGDVIQSTPQSQPLVLSLQALASDDIETILERSCLGPSAQCSSEVDPELGLGLPFAADVPEPSAGALTALGILWLAWRRRDAQRRRGSDLS